MSDARPRLEAVKFAGSRHARAIGGLEKPVVIDAISRFLEACYRDSGAAPEKLDGETLREAVLVHLARRCGPKEPFVPRMAELLRAFLAHLEETTLVPQLYEMRRALDEIGDRFEMAVKGVPDVERRLDSGTTTPIRRPSEKVGRNDPCPCGSGKKYKQCCLRLGS